MNDNRPPRRRAWPRWLEQPIVHFFAVGALLFTLHGWRGEDAHLIVVTPGLRAELARRFEDQHGRPPTSDEAEAALSTWKHEEAVFREGLRRHLEEDDPTVRAAVIHKMQAIFSLETPEPRPSEADLSDWLSTHRATYEQPVRYDYEFLSFAKGEPSSAAALADSERALAEGAAARSLGRPLRGGKLAAPDLATRVPLELAARIPSAPVGIWQRVEGAEEVWLLRVKATLGGLPPFDELRPRLITDWAAAKRQQTADAALARAVSEYRFEEQR